MLSLFPELLFLAPFAALLIRVSVAVVFAYSAWQRVQSADMMLRVFAAFDAVIAVLLFVGLYTQLAALAAAVCAAAWLIWPTVRPYTASTSALTLVLAISLVLTGAGPFAFDLPL